MNNQEIVMKAKQKNKWTEKMATYCQIDHNRI